LISHIAKQLISPENVNILVCRQDWTKYTLTNWVSVHVWQLWGQWWI